MSAALGGVGNFKPRHVTPNDVDSASHVVTIDCDPQTIPVAKVEIEHWDDVPKMSEDLEGSMAAIRRHVGRLVEELLAGR